MGLNGGEQSKAACLEGMQAAGNRSWLPARSGKAPTRRALSRVAAAAPGQPAQPSSRAPAMCSAALRTRGTSAHPCCAAEALGRRPGRATAVAAAAAAAQRWHATRGSPEWLPAAARLVFRPAAGQQRRQQEGREEAACCEPAPHPWTDARVAAAARQADKGGAGQLAAPAPDQVGTTGSLPMEPLAGLQGGNRLGGLPPGCQHGRYLRTCIAWLLPCPQRGCSPRQCPGLRRRRHGERAALRRRTWCRHASHGMQSGAPSLLPA